MSNILLAIIGWDPKGWETRFRALAPQHQIRVWPEQVGDPAEIDYACAWNPPQGLLADYPNLKAIFSLGAGADVLLQVLMCHRRQRLYDTQQRERLWRDHDQPAANEVSVGIMGLGELGTSAASLLHRIAFRVAGWSRTQK